MGAQQFCRGFPLRLGKGLGDLFRKLIFCQQTGRRRNGCEGESNENNGDCSDPVHWDGRLQYIMDILGVASTASKLPAIAHQWFSTGMWRRGGSRTGLNMKSPETRCHGGVSLPPGCGVIENIAVGEPRWSAKVHGKGAGGLPAAMRSGFGLSPHAGLSRVWTEPPCTMHRRDSGIPSGQSQTAWTKSNPYARWCGTWAPITPWNPILLYRFLSGRGSNSALGPKNRQ